MGEARANIAMAYAHVGSQHLVMVIGPGAELEDGTAQRQHNEPEESGTMRSNEKLAGCDRFELFSEAAGLVHHQSPSTHRLSPKGDEEFLLVGDLTP